jgi:hypothetical protein
MRKGRVGLMDESFHLVRVADRAESCSCPRLDTQQKSPGILLDDVTTYDRYPISGRSVLHWIQEQELEHLQAVTAFNPICIARKEQKRFGPHKV